MPEIPQEAKIAFNRKAYNEVIGVVEEIGIEITAGSIKECRLHFEEIMSKHDKFNHKKV
jgi:hypothetical protein